MGEWDFVACFFATFGEQESRRQWCSPSFFVPIVSFEQAQPNSMCAMFENGVARDGDDTHAPS